MSISDREDLRGAPPSIAWFDRWAFLEYRCSPFDLAVFRFIYVVVGFVLAVPDLDRISGLPATALDPPFGPFRLLSDWPPRWIPESLEIVLCVALVLLLIGWRTVATSYVVALTFVVSLGLLYGTGKIGHGLIVFSVLPVFLAHAGWGEVWSIDAARSTRSPRMRAWPVALLALTVGLMFATAARPKIEAGWLSPASQAVQRTVLERVLIDGVDSSFTDRLTDISSRAFWEAIDIGTIALELGLLFLVIRRRWFVFGLCGAVLLHVSIYVVLSIGFPVQIFAYGAFVHWSRVLASLRPLGSPLAAAGRAATRQPVAVLVAIAVAVGIGLQRAIDRLDVRAGGVPRGVRNELVPAVFWCATGVVLAYVALETWRGTSRRLRSRRADAPA